MEAEPTEDQLAALQLRIIGRGGTPYADFTVPHIVWSEASIKLHYEVGHGFCSQMEVTRRSSSQALRTSPLGQLAGVSTRLRVCA